MGCCLIQNQDGRVSVEGSRQGYFLLLTTGKQLATFADGGPQVLGEFLQQGLQSDCPADFVYAIQVGLLGVGCDVLDNASFEQSGLLGNQADPITPGIGRKKFGIQVIHQYLSLIGTEGA